MKQNTFSYDEAVWFCKKSSTTLLDNSATGMFYIRVHAIGISFYIYIYICVCVFMSNGTWSIHGFYVYVLHTAATRAGPHQPVHCQPAHIYDWERPWDNVHPLWPSDLHPNPAWQQWHQSRRGLRPHGEQREVWTDHWSLPWQGYTRYCCGVNCTLLVEGSVCNWGTGFFPRRDSQIEGAISVCQVPTVLLSIPCTVSVKIPQFVTH